jgi:hypothetical protein
MGFQRDVSLWQGAGREPCKKGGLKKQGLPCVIIARWAITKPLGLSCFSAHPFGGSFAYAQDDVGEAKNSAHPFGGSLTLLRNDAGAKDKGKKGGKNFSLRKILKLLHNAVKTVYFFSPLR